MISVDLAFPLAAGLIAAFNPCGFAMLPAYLSYFLGVDTKSGTDRYLGILNGLKVSLALSMGFVFIFAALGVLTNTVISESSIEKRAGYITLTIGILLILLGLAMIRGFHPVLNIPRLKTTGMNRQLPSMFLFGVSYAIVSVGCSAPIFFVTVGGSFSRDGIVDGIAVFIAYALGMSIVITVLTLSIALARSSIAQHLKKVLKHLNTISGFFLTISGFFLAAYGWWEIQVSRGNYGTNPLVDLSLRGSGRLSNWVNDVGGGRFAMACLMIVIGFLIWIGSSQVLDREKRFSLRGVYLGLLALIEITIYEFDLLLVPFVRTIGDLPIRFQNWFSDPFRWAAFWEIVFFLSLVTFSNLSFLAAFRKRKDSQKFERSLPENA
ncbi:MAG: cytochrome c biogenesis protein CcdA [Acidimicrobiales bacterium]|jgi:cytochrome c biogenesis protein CcdA|nr:cytochrome c biogenesis protein CcdA [Acidimicrobiales bacterium]HJM29199.1 cytochrome c biogenesis protein CcdA [Acidimicrobiales bacterium]HJM96744.1 cytochrome c biogenesis protein CcdA [Acidimicrobiales bacterium]